MVVYKLSERFLQFLDGRALEGDDVFEVDDPAVKDPGLVVELDVLRVASVLRRYFTRSARSWILKHAALATA